MDAFTLALFFCGCNNSDNDFDDDEDDMNEDDLMY